MSRSEFFDDTSSLGEAWSPRTESCSSAAAAGRRKPWRVPSKVCGGVTGAGEGIPVLEMVDGVPHEMVPL